MFLLAEIVRHAAWMREHFPCIVAGIHSVYYFTPDRAAVVEWTANGQAKLEGYADLVPDPFYTSPVRVFTELPRYQR